MPGQKQKSSTPERPAPKYAGSQILLWGSLLWKLVGDMSNIDFLMSIDHPGIRDAFQITLTYGIWGLAGIGGIWWGAVVYKWVSRPSWQSTVAAVAIMSFLWGALITAEFTNSVPQVSKSWGGGGERGCISTFDTSRLQSYKKRFDLALICGFHDPSMDLLTDTRVSISNKFNIPPNDLTVLAAYNPEMINVYKMGKPVSTWHFPVLVPKDVDMANIHSLADVRKHGGKILTRGYFD